MTTPCGIGLTSMLPQSSRAFDLSFTHQPATQRPGRTRPPRVLPAWVAGFRPSVQREADLPKSPPAPTSRKFGFGNRVDICHPTCVHDIGELGAPHQYGSMMPHSERVDDPAVSRSICLCTRQTFFLF